MRSSRSGRWTDASSARARRDRSRATWRRASGRSSGAERILSVVVPTLNESARLPRLVGDLAALAVPHEIVVADGGSTDGTADVARALGCRVVGAAESRGRQLRAGIAASGGAWLLVLHADARLAPAALREAESALTRGDVQHASWPLAIDAPGLWLRVVELGARLRWRAAGLAYGDQGLLVRRTLYDAAGGYPDLPIMEDVVLTRRLNRLARGTRFRQPIRADARRWRREGQLRGTLRNLLLLTLFLSGVTPDRLARWYRPESRSS